MTPTLRSRHRSAALAAAALALAACEPAADRPREEAAAAPEAGQWADVDAPWSCGKTDAGSIVMPADVYGGSDPTRSDVDDFSWQSFLWATAAENWSRWLSTVDLIECNQYDADVGIDFVYFLGLEVPEARQDWTAAAAGGSP